MASISVKLVPFPLPAEVYVSQPPGRREDGIRPSQRLKLTELSPETLHEMCEEFRTAVFEAAGYNPLYRRVEPMERGGPDDR